MVEAAQQPFLDPFARRFTDHGAGGIGFFGRVAHHFIIFANNGAALFLIFRIGEDAREGRAIKVLHGARCFAWHHHKFLRGKACDEQSAIGFPGRAGRVLPRGRLQKFREGRQIREIRIAHNITRSVQDAVGE